MGYEARSQLLTPGPAKVRAQLQAAKAENAPEQFVQAEVNQTRHQKNLPCHPWQGNYTSPRSKHRHFTADATPVSCARARSKVRDSPKPERSAPVRKPRFDTVYTPLPDSCLSALQACS